LSQLLQDRVLVRKRTGLQFRVDRLAVDDKLEAAPVGRDQRQRAHLLLECTEDLRRQTDGLRFVVSSSAVG